MPLIGSKQRFRGEGVSNSTVDGPTMKAMASPIAEPVRSSKPKKPNKRHAGNEWIHG